MILSPRARAKDLFERAQNLHMEAGMSELAAYNAARTTVNFGLDIFLEIWGRVAYPHYNFHRVVNYWGEVKTELNKNY